MDRMEVEGRLNLASAVAVPREDGCCEGWCDVFLSVVGFHVSQEREECTHPHRLVKAN